MAEKDGIEGQFIVDTVPDQHDTNSRRKLQGSSGGIDIKAEWGSKAALSGLVAEMTSE